MRRKTIIKKSKRQKNKFTNHDYSAVKSYQNKISEFSEISTDKKTIDQVDFLWKVLSRYDHYIESTNNKASIVTALNTFILGVASLKYEMILSSRYAVAFFILALISLLLSLCFSLCAIFPNLSSPPTTENVRSLIFFEDVANTGINGDRHYERILEVNETELKKDLANQVHSIAKILKSKFKHLKRAYFSLAISLIFITTSLLVSIFFQAK